MHEARTISVSIAHPWSDVYDAIWRPEDFPQWASGLSRSPLVKDGDVWHADGPEGRISVRFTGHNAFGVMDHHVSVVNGAEIYIPLRVVSNSEGAEVLLTLFRQPEMSDAKFEADAAWVERDLQALKAFVTRQLARPR
jgi:hypothetical protein